MVRARTQAGHGLACVHNVQAAEGGCHDRGQGRPPPLPGRPVLAAERGVQRPEGKL